MLLSSTSPSAEDSPGYPLHAGFALGFASAGSDCDYYGHNCDGTDTTFKIYAGKRVHENLGLEIAYHDLGKLRDQGFTSSTTAESQGVNLSLLGIIPTSNLGMPITPPAVASPVAAMKAAATSPMAPDSHSPSARTTISESNWSGSTNWARTSPAAAPRSRCCILPAASISTSGNNYQSGRRGFALR
jgi:hypothetical protein